MVRSGATLSSILASPPSIFLSFCAFATAVEVRAIPKRRLRRPVSTCVVFSSEDALAPAGAVA